MWWRGAERSCPEQPRRHTARVEESVRESGTFNIHKCRSPFAKWHYVFAKCHYTFLMCRFAFLKCHFTNAKWHFPFAKVPLYIVTSAAFRPLHFVMEKHAHGVVLLYAALTPHHLVILHLLFASIILKYIRTPHVKYIKKSSKYVYFSYFCIILKI